MYCKNCGDSGPIYCFEASVRNYKAFFAASPITCVVLPLPVPPVDGEDVYPGPPEDVGARGGGGGHGGVRGGGRSRGGNLLKNQKKTVFPSSVFTLSFCTSLTESESCFFLLGSRPLRMASRTSPRTDIVGETMKSMKPVKRENTYTNLYVLTSSRRHLHLSQSLAEFTYIYVFFSA